MAFKIRFGAAYIIHGNEDSWPTRHEAERVVAKRVERNLTQPSNYDIIEIPDEIKPKTTLGDEGGLEALVERIKDEPSPEVYYGSLKPEPIDVIEGWGLDFYLSNVVKYVARAGRKRTEAASELKDLRKAAKYLNRKINRLAGTPGW